MPEMPQLMNAAFVGFSATVRLDVMGVIGYYNNHSVVIDAFLLQELYEAAKFKVKVMSCGKVAPH